jgi:DNA polymerase III sliding clamp (beta) subunit (PCNA family)
MKVTIDAATAAIAVKAAAMAAGKDLQKPHLTGVRIAPGSTPDTVTFTATDGYRLHHVEVSGTYSGYAPADGVLINAKDLSSAVATVAKAAKPSREPMVIISAGDETGHLAIVTSRAGNSDLATASAHIQIGNFPPFANLLTGDEMESGATFCPDYFADLMSAAALLGTKKEPVLAVVEALQVSKPAVVTAKRGPVAFTGVLMPMRKGN